MSLRVRWRWFWTFLSWKLIEPRRGLAFQNSLYCEIHRELAAMHGSPNEEEHVDEMVDLLISFHKRDFDDSFFYRWLSISYRFREDEAYRERFVHKAALAICKEMSVEHQEVFVDYLLRHLSRFDLSENSSYDWKDESCLLYTSPSPRDATLSRMPSSA